VGFFIAREVVADYYGLLPGFSLWKAAGRLTALPGAPEETVTFPRGNLEISAENLPGSVPCDGTPRDIGLAGFIGRTGDLGSVPKGWERSRAFSRKTCGLLDYGLVVPG